MGDADRSAEDVIAALLATPIVWSPRSPGYEHLDSAHDDHIYDGACAVCRFSDRPEARKLVAEFIAERVVPAADVDAAARLRGLIDHFVDIYPYSRAVKALREAAAAVGSVDPEGERCPTCGSDDPDTCLGRVPGVVAHPHGSGTDCCPNPWHSPNDSEDTQPWQVVLDELIVTEPDEGFTRRQVADEILDALAAAGYAVVPQRDVDAAARLRGEMALLNNGIDAIRQCWHADESPRWTANVIEALRHSGLIDDAWAAAAVGSVDPGEDCDCHDGVVPVTGRGSDGYELCPTCGSDDPELVGVDCADSGDPLQPDPWHSPDTGREA